MRLLSNWLADWRRMYDFPAGGRPALAGPNGVNFAQRIDTLLTDPLKNLPPSTFGGGAGIPFDDPRRNLAFRNLTRGSMLKLASGQQMVEHLNSLGVHVEPLTEAQILNGRGGADLTSLPDEAKQSLATRTPLWFYVLREAETGTGKLRTGRRADRRRDVPPRHRGQPVLDPARPGLPAAPRPRREHLRDDRPDLLRLRREEVGHQSPRWGIGATAKPPGPAPWVVATAARVREVGTNAPRTTSDRE